MTVVPWLPNSYFDPFSVNKKIDGVIKRPISLGPDIDYHRYTCPFGPSVYPGSLWGALLLVSH